MAGNSVGGALRFSPKAKWIVENDAFSNGLSLQNLLSYQRENIHQGRAMELNKEQPSSPQKEGVKARSKSTEEMQPAKKAFHTPQKSLPNKMDEDESKGSCSVPPSDASQQKQT